jgi:Subtilase family
MRTVLLSVAAMAALVATPRAEEQETPTRPAELVAVHTRDFGTAAPLLRQAGATLVSRRLGLWRAPPTSSASVLSELRRRGWLRAHEPERALVSAVTLPGEDPLALDQWWLPRIGAQGLEPPPRGLPVTVVDGGLDLGHPEFAARPDTQALNEQTLVGSRAFHGTAVSSVIAAPENGLGFVGLYPAADLRMWDASPAAVLTQTDVVAGIEAAAARGRGVINLSLGGSRSRFEAEAINAAFARGLLVVAAAGNGRRSGVSENFPASLPHVLTVASLDRQNQVSSFSSRSSGMDLAAPGEQIWVAVPTSFDASGFVQSSGTSFSAPIVAAAAAWVWRARPRLDNTQIFELMRRSARDLGRKGRDQDTGFGLLSLRSALSLPAPPVDPLEPNDVPSETEGQPPVPARLTARLDVTDDPRDFYRVLIPAGGRVTATITSRVAVPLQLVSRGGSTTIQRLRGKGRRWLLENVATEPAVALVKLHLPLDAEATHTTYRLRLR